MRRLAFRWPSRSPQSKVQNGLEAPGLPGPQSRISGGVSGMGLIPRGIREVFRRASNGRRVSSQSPAPSFSPNLTHSPQAPMLSAHNPRRVTVEDASDDSASRVSYVTEQPTHPHSRQEGAHSLAPPQYPFSVRGSDALTVMSFPPHLATAERSDTSSHASRTEPRQDYVERDRGNDWHDERYQAPVYTPQPGSPVTVGGVRVEVRDSQDDERPRHPSRHSSSRSPPPRHHSSTSHRSHHSASSHRDGGGHSHERGVYPHESSGRHAHHSTSRSYSSRHSSRSASSGYPYVTHGPDGRIIVHVEDGTRVRIGNDVEGFVSYEEYVAREAERAQTPPLQYVMVPSGYDYVFVNERGQEISRSGSSIGFNAAQSDARSTSSSASPQVSVRYTTPTAQSSSARRHHGAHYQSPAHSAYSRAVPQQVVYS